MCLFFVYFLCLCATLLSPPFPCGRVCYLLLSGISYLGWRGAVRQRAYQMPRLGGSQIRLDRVFLGSRFSVKVSRSSILDIRRDHLLLPATNVFHLQPDQDGSRVFFRFLISGWFHLASRSDLLRIGQDEIICFNSWSINMLPGFQKISLDISFLPDWKSI